MYIRIVFLICCLSSVALAQSYRWKDVQQDVTIHRNGSVHVVDERTLIATDGDFGEAFICLHLKGEQRISLIDARSLDHSASRGYTQDCQDDDTKGAVELVVKHDSRQRSSRVRYEYTLDGSLDYYSDVTEWYWIILEQDHPIIDGYQLHVQIPEPMAEPYDAYVHRFRNTELPAVVLSPNRQELEVSFKRIPEGSGVEVRYLMNPSMFAQQGTKKGLEKLLRDETRVAGVRVARESPFLSGIGAAILALLGLGMGTTYRRVGRDPDIPRLQYAFEPPSDIPPAAVQAMLQKQSSNNLRDGFNATVMELARKGFVEFTHDNRTNRRKKMEMALDLDKPTNGLEDIEKEVWQYLQRAASHKGTPDYLDYKELRQYSEKKFSTFFEPWVKRVRSWVEFYFPADSKGKQSLTTPESRGAAQRWSFFGFLGMVVCGVLAWFSIGATQFLFAGCAAACLVTIILSNSMMLAWRPEVAQEVYGWQAFKRTLRDFSRMKDAPDDFFHLWDKYYCYAAALGVAKQYLSNIQKAIPLRNLDERSMMRQGSWMSASGNDMQSFSNNDFGQFSKSINSLSSALNSSGASASSGGSSSGGGAGGGGGSSGGR